MSASLRALFLMGQCVSAWCLALSMGRRWPVGPAGALLVSCLAFPPGGLCVVTPTPLTMSPGPAGSPCCGEPTSREAHRFPPLLCFWWQNLPSFQSQNPGAATPQSFTARNLSSVCLWGGRGTQSEGLGLGLPLLGRLWSPAPLVFCFLPLSALMMLCYQATPVQRLLSAEDTGGPRRSTGPRGRDRLQPRLYSHLWH